MNGANVTEADFKAWQQKRLNELGKLLRPWIGLVPGLKLHTPKPWETK